jgi:hypothetical protein
MLHVNEFCQRIVAKFVPRLMQNEQKQHRLEVCTELQQQIQEDPNFLPKVVTDSVRLLSLPKMKVKMTGRRFGTVEGGNAGGTKRLSKKKKHF